MGTEKKELHASALPIIFILSLLCAGIFHEFYSCAFGVVLSIYILIKVRKDKHIVIWKNWLSLSMMILCGFYLVSILWATDSGMAWIGFLKFLPVLLFLIAFMQEERAVLIIRTILPYVAAGITAVSFIGMQIPMLSSYFSVAGRLAGSFQYPNTYALFLLVSELLLLDRKKKKVWDYLVLVILVGGLLLTGSRTVFLLAILANIILIFMQQNKKVRIGGLIGIAVLVIVLLGVVILSDGADMIARLFRISLTESTFVGRLLYFIDALPVLLKHPFGLGYLGYYYVQQSIQTGLYSVRYIHNDFLQIMLDVGWIPCALFIGAIVKSLVHRDNPFVNRLILLTMCLHSCFDFNLQFIAMFWLFLLFTDYNAGEKLVIKKRLQGVHWTASGLAIVSTYCGLALFLAHIGKNELSLTLYPWNTQAATAYLTELDDIDEAGEVADGILKCNEYVTLAQSVKARQAYAKGNFEDLILYKRELLDQAPFQYEEYEEYCYMLVNGISLYTKAGDTQSAALCRQELLSIPDRLQGAEDRLSKFGKMIKDQPTTELPAEIITYIKRLEGAQ